MKASDYEFQLRELIHQDLRLVAQTRKISDIARATELSHSTIVRHLYGRTSMLMPLTMFKLAEYLDIEITFRRKYNSNLKVVK